MRNGGRGRAACMAAMAACTAEGGSPLSCSMSRKRLAGGMAVYLMPPAAAAIASGGSGQLLSLAMAACSCVCTLCVRDGDGRLLRGAAGRRSAWPCAEAVAVGRRRMAQGVCMYAWLPAIHAPPAPAVRQQCEHSANTQRNVHTQLILDPDAPPPPPEPLPTRHHPPQPPPDSPARPPARPSTHHHAAHTPALHPLPSARLPARPSTHPSTAPPRSPGAGRPGRPAGACRCASGPCRSG